MSAILSRPQCVKNILFQVTSKETFSQYDWVLYTEAISIVSHAGDDGLMDGYNHLSGMHVTDTSGVGGGGWSKGGMWE